MQGAVEGVKGKAKEVGGAVLGRDDLADEGRAQQDKADAQRDAGKKEAEAESARAGADAAEERQKKTSKPLARGVRSGPGFKPPRPVIPAVSRWSGRAVDERGGT